MNLILPIKSLTATVRAEVANRLSVSLFVAAFALLTLPTATVFGQSYPCIDYNRIKSAYDHRFDLYLGGFVFTGGIIRPENTLQPHEIDRVIDDVIVEYARRKSGGTARLTSVADPCSIVEPFNKAVDAMNTALGEDHSQALNKVYEQAIKEFTRNTASAAAPPMFSVVANIAKGDQAGLASDIPGSMGNFYKIFSDLFKAHQNYNRIMDNISRNRNAILDGREAELALNEFYADIHEAIKRKMGRMRWLMEMRSFDRYIITRTFMGVSVPVEYSVALDMKKVVEQSDTFVGAYKGTITFTMEMKQGAPGSSFDDIFPAQAGTIKRPVQNVMGMVPQGRHARLLVTPNSPTTFKLTARAIADVSVKRASRCDVDADFEPDKPEFHFDYGMRAIAVNHLGGGISAMKEEFNISSTAEGQVNIQLSGNGSLETVTPAKSMTSGRYLEGWPGTTVDLGSHNLLEPLQGLYLIVKAKDEK